MRTMEQGMTLLEVLLAVLVVSLGLFAVAALQLRALQATDSARLNGQAAMLAHAMLERARAAGNLDGQAQWQTQVTAVLGAGGEGRTLRSADELAVEVDWPDPVEGARRTLRLQGRVLP